MWYRQVPKDLSSYLVVGGDSLKKQDGILARWFNRQQCTVAIVRPYHSVYGAANSADETRKLLDSLRKRLMAEGLTRATERAKSVA